MKKIFVFAVITVAMSLVSCGATKQATNNDYQYQHWLAQQNQQQSQTVETTFGNQRKEEVKDPWFELQSQATDRLRGAADATSSLKAAATQMAITNATSNLAASIEVAAQTARAYVIHAMNLDDNSAASSEFAEEMRQMATQSLAFTKPLMTKTYQLENGHFQVGHCFEMIETITELRDKIANAVNKSVIKQLGNIATEEDKAQVIKHTERAKELLDFSKK